MEEMHLRAIRNGVAAAVVTALAGFLLRALVGPDASSEAETSPTPTATASPTCTPAARPLDRSAVRGIRGRVADVWFPGAGRAWAVGSAGEEDTPTAVLATWDGDRWRPSPEADTLGTAALTAVDGLGPADVWTVGWSTDGFGRDGLVAHWNGARWSFSTPVPEGDLADVRVLADDDVWAVGWVGNPDVAPERAAVMHWDGSSWTQFAIPAGGGRSALLSIAGTADDLWAAGYHHLGALLMHFDGTSWRRANVGGKAGPLTAVAAAHGRVWAAGDGVFTGARSSFGEVLGAPKGGSFTDVAPVSASTALAVGSAAKGGRSGSVAVAIDGRKARFIPVRAPGSDELDAVAIARNQVWVAGWHTTAKAAAPLVAALTTCL